MFVLRALLCTGAPVDRALNFIRKRQANGAGCIKLDYCKHAMNELREHLHRLVDQLPDHALDHAKSALVYCGNLEKHRMTIENAKRRAMENSERSLREYAERTGSSFMSGMGTGTERTSFDGNHHSSMVAFEDGRDATYHLHMYRGTVFEIIETIEISEDGQRIIRRERIKGFDGLEHILTAELPLSPPT